MTNKWHLNQRFVSPSGLFASMFDLTKTTKDPNAAWMGTKEQVDNCLKRYPELEGFEVQEVVPEKAQVLR